MPNSFFSPFGLGGRIRPKHHDTLGPLKFAFELFRETRVTYRFDVKVSAKSGVPEGVADWLNGNPVLKRVAERYVGYASGHMNRDPLHPGAQYDKESEGPTVSIGEY
jgi:hypothetical protein